jgi:hypothetical protein
VNVQQGANFYPAGPVYLVFLAAFFFAAGGLAGLLFPNEPLKRLPLAVFLSPLPMMIFFME